MTVDIKVARKEIVSAFSHHWEMNDRGHRAEHFEDVFQCAKHINNVLDLKHDEVSMLFAGYFHDFFAWSRINHHTLARQYFHTTDHPVIVKYFGECPFGREKVAYACAEHRASYNGDFSSQFSELINSADRGFPGDVTKLLRRSFKHRRDINPETPSKEVLVLTLEHMKEKAGTNGYARYPDLYMQVFAEKLKEQKEEIDNLTFGDSVEKVFGL